MKVNKVKLLSNFQLFQLAQNESLDDETLMKVRHEFESRNIATLEMKEMKQQYNAPFEDSRKELDATHWNPFYTAFAWKRHFKIWLYYEHRVAKQRLSNIKYGSTLVF